MPHAPLSRSASCSSSSSNESGSELCRVVVDLLLFYTTSFFVLLAIFSIFSLIFLVPFFIDPAWSTLQAEFDPQGTKCTTITGHHLEGKSLCSWSSCEEGCTKTIYTCWQVEVEYELPGVEVGPNRDVPVSWAKLFANVKGCGYPPRTICSDFVAKYAQNGSTFTCYVSQKDPTLAIVELNLSQVHQDLFYCLAIPLPCLFVSIVYIIVAYFYIYPDPAQKSYRAVSTLSTVSAMAALVNVPGATGPVMIESNEEKQRKLLLMQAQKAKMLASSQQSSTKSATALIRSAVASASAASASLVTHKKKCQEVNSNDHSQTHTFSNGHGIEVQALHQPDSLGSSSSTNKHGGSKKFKS